MVAALSQRSYPRYGIATFIVLVLFVGLPILLYVANPGPAGEVTAASEVVDTDAGFTYTAPAGWGRTSGAGGTVVLEKGGAQIEFQFVAWTGTPAELYERFKEQIGTVATVTSISDPTPTTINGIPAVTGTAHLIVDGTDTTQIVVVAADGTSGLVTDLNGAILVITPLQEEFEQMLSTVVFGS